MRAALQPRVLAPRAVKAQGEQPTAPHTAAIGKGNPLFSPDGRHAVYRARVGDSSVVVVDGKEQKIYDLILTEIAFLSASEIQYFAIKDNKVYRVNSRI